MSKIVTGSCTPCTASTAGDTCVTGQCLSQTSSYSAVYLTCINPIYCGGTQQAVYSSCQQDQFNNTCAHKCCGNYTSTYNGSTTSIKVCESVSMCDDLYSPSIFAKASMQQVKDFQRQVSGGIGTKTAIALGVGLGLIGVINVVLALLLWRMMKIRRRLKDQLEDYEITKGQNIPKKLEKKKRKKNKGNDKEEAYQDRRAHL